MEEKHESAIDESRIGLQGLPDDTELTKLEAFSLMESDISRSDEACDLLRKTLEDSPTSPELHTALATCYLIRGGRDREAYQELRKAAEMNPPDDKVYSLLATVIAAGRDGVAYKGEVLESLKKAIMLNPENWGNYKSLGLEYWKMGSLRDARFSFEMAIETMTSGKLAISGSELEAERKRLEHWIKALGQNRTFQESDAVPSGVESY